MLIARLQTAGQHLRLRPFDTSSEDGRSRERHRRALLTMLANVAAKALGLAVMILSLRLALPYLGQERYGVLATIVSFSALLTFLDLGIGNALISEVAQLGGRDDRALALLVSRAFWVLMVIGLIVSVTLSAGAVFAPLAWAFKGVGPKALEEGRRTLLLFAVLFGISIPIGAIQKIFQGLQRGYLVHLSSAGCSVLGLGLLYILTTRHAAMPAFLFVGYGMQVVSGGLLFTVLARKISRPKAGYFRGPGMHKLLRVGGLFFLLQIGVIAGWGSDPLMLSSTIGPMAVVVFTITDRISQFISVPLAMVNAPLWASYADALAKGDTQYMRRTLRVSMALTAIAASALAIAVFLTSDFWFRVLSKDVLRVPRLYLAFYLTWAIVRALGDCFAMYMNGVHVLRPQLVVAILFIAVSIPAKLFCAGNYGLPSFIAASVACYVLAVVVPYLTVFKEDIFRPVN